MRYTTEQITALVEQTKPYHHPHFVSAAPSDLTGHIRFVLRAFTGTEPEPTRPPESYHHLNPDIDAAASRFLGGMYDFAHRTWREACYVRAYKDAAGPDTIRAWTTHQETRRALEKAFTAATPAPTDQ
ncbi:hypothetical protein [Streptomyces sp. ST2-7A]|uniref:hypothetical protein n=1 Tax=Streptomyces sp. ST2-7A TaxID=2907214 RepID=UPI001F37C38D|nr:hypothetical protein [Streptomyces sp. ST2-7A]MCE7081192.1 hypothetical protein [Streptomyces sp. ST2-7A]